MNNRTFTLIKPNAIAGKHTGEILHLIEAKGFRIIAMKMLQLTTTDAAKFYSVHSQRPFFRNLSLFMTAGPVIAMVLEKENAVEDFRELTGNTDPEIAAEGTIRKLFAESKTRNAIHASESDERAKWECSFFFSEREITTDLYRLPVPESEIDKD